MAEPRRAQRRGAGRAVAETASLMRAAVESGRQPKAIYRAAGRAPARVRRADPLARTGRRQPHHLLVPRLPGLRPAATRCRRSGARAAAGVALGGGERRRRSAPRVSAGSITSSSSNSVAALSALAFSSRGGGQLAHALLALGLVGDRLELRAQAEPHRALEAHRAELGASARRRSAAARAGCRRPSPGRRGRSRGAGSRRRAARAAPRRRRAAASSGARAPVASASGPTMIPGVSTSETTGRPNASQSCRKRAALSAPSLVIAPARCIGLLAMTPSGRPSIRASAVTISGAKRSRRNVTEPVVGERLDHRPRRRRRAARRSGIDVAQRAPGRAPRQAAVVPWK